MLFSEPKIPQLRRHDAEIVRVDAVSVLFSEPKIPQYAYEALHSVLAPRFSALQRAENSSIIPELRWIVDWLGFQCSSASRKFLNSLADTAYRAYLEFQCSSASRKFLNKRATDCFLPLLRCFSALQRAENSSIDGSDMSWDGSLVFQCSSASRKFLNATYDIEASIPLPFQCSSASRKFLNRNCSTTTRAIARVSVLFSEPKIPQSLAAGAALVLPICFSALQRAENSSIESATPTEIRLLFVSVLFSEPKIPQSLRAMIEQRRGWFQCSSASRKFLNSVGSPHPATSGVSFSALQRAENSSISETI